MVASVTAQEMSRRIGAFAQDLSTKGMSNACAAALRPVRRFASRRNVGFTDRTGKTRSKVGKIRKYAPRTVRKYRSGGAYFRGGSKVGAILEYKYQGRYAWLSKASNATRSSQLSNFTQAGRREVEKSARRARRKLVQGLLR